MQNNSKVGLKTIKTFLAVSPSDSFRELAKRFIASLENESEFKNVRLVKPENIHLTLKFLGQVTKEQCETIIHSLKNKKINTSPFEITCGLLHPFPSSNKPHILALDLDEREQLSELASICESASRKIVGKASHSFKAHLTIGRLKQGEFPLIEKADFFQGLTMPVNEMILFEYVQVGGGIRYDVLERFSLSRHSRE